MNDRENNIKYVKYNIRHMLLMNVRSGLLRVNETGDFVINM